MSTVIGQATIPEHLPRRLTISFRFGFLASDIEPGEGFADLERAFRDLVVRGFSTVRVDGLWSWRFTPEGKPRGPVEVGNVARPARATSAPV
jgi:hypothetical protein